MAGGRLGGLTALCLALAASVSVAASGGAARIAIDSCIEKLNPEIDIGYDRIAIRCPDLARRLEESGSSVWLPPDWKRGANDLSAGGLRELEDLLARQSRYTAGPDARAHRLSTERLSAVLASLVGNDPAGRNGWWARTKAWLRYVFERREEEDDDWFSRVVGQSGLPQAVIELVSYVALALVVVLAGVIVVNELRVDGVLERSWRRFVRRRSVRLSEARPASGTDGWTWSDVKKATPDQQPRLLLEMLASRLTAEGRLPQARGLTTRELIRAARLHNTTDREKFAELARVCEYMTFSNSQTSSETIGAALEGGRMLLTRMNAHEQG